MVLTRFIGHLDERIESAGVRHEEVACVVCHIAPCQPLVPISQSRATRWCHPVADVHFGLRWDHLCVHCDARY